MAQYRTFEFGGSMNPVDVINSFTGRTDIDKYWIYGSPEETRIAISSIGEVAIDNDYIQSSWDGAVTRREKANDVFEQLDDHLSDMPIEKWTAYGSITFDAAGYYFPYNLRSPSSPIRFSIPRTEVIIKNDSTTIRTTDRSKSMYVPPYPVTFASLGRQLLFKLGKPNVPEPDKTDQDEYEQKVRALLDDIRSGILDKAIIARRVDFDGDLDVLSTYASLRNGSLAARFFAFQQPDLLGVGASPELLMQTTDRGLVTSTPLAGTRPRGVTPEQDDALRHELEKDPKELREHRMSAELVRTEELKKVCRVGSVAVREQMHTVQFSKVQHLASSISGQLAPKTRWHDALRALFPGVTVSGIDKDAAVRRIGELEQVPRGLYAGTIGWIDSRGRSDLALAIRAAFQDSSGTYSTAGAGIIEESKPEREYQESRDKMKTILSHLVLN